MGSSVLIALIDRLTGSIRSERGQTMAEYGILIAVIAVIVVLAATLFGANVTKLFSSAGGHL